MPTAATEDYLKAIYKLQRRSGSAANAAIAEELGVKPASVTGMVGKLVQMGLVRHAPYQGVQLSGDGEKVALEVLRHHRLVELYLTEFLGYPLDRVHEEADRLEHVISNELEERIAAKLGHPTVDPHGDPIPTREGSIAETGLDRLSEIAPDTAVVVRRVSDSDPDRLRYLAGLGLLPNAEVRVVAVEPFGGPVILEVNGVRHALGRELASTVGVSRT
jgi:DtxR family Mn-dependent transcriptional regulator